MGDRTKRLSKSGIPYADYGWNIVRGCSKDGRPGCLNCWAARQCATRLKHLPEYAGLAEKFVPTTICSACHGHGVEEVPDRPAGWWQECSACKGMRSLPLTGDAGRPWYDWTGEVRFDPAELERPLHTRKPGVVFTVPRGDLFHEQVTDAQIASAFLIMDQTPHLTYYVLTKRWRRAQEWCSEFISSERPVANFLPIFSVWDQPSADAAIPDLLATPAAVRGVSVEPMLSDIDLMQRETCDECGGHGFRWVDGCGPSYVNSYPNAEGAPCHKVACETCGGDFDFPGEGEVETFPDLDWLILGGETGPGARPMDPEWALSVYRQCKAAGTAFWFKDWAGKVRPPMTPDLAEMEATHERPGTPCA